MTRTTYADVFSEGALGRYLRICAIVSSVSLAALALIALIPPFGALAPIATLLFVIAFYPALMVLGHLGVRWVGDQPERTAFMFAIGYASAALVVCSALHAIDNLGLVWAMVEGGLA